MRRLDLLVIKPGAQKRLYQNLSRSLSGLEPPLWAALIADFIRDNMENLRTQALRKILEEVTDHIGRHSSHDIQPHVKIDFVTLQDLQRDIRKFLLDEKADD